MAKQIEEMTAEELLDFLSEAYSAQEVARLAKEEAVASLIPLEIKQKIFDVELEYKAKEAAGKANVSQAEKRAKELTEAHQGTLRGKFFMCVFNPGGKTVSVSDVEKFATKLELKYPKLAAELRSYIKPKKASSSIQAISKK